MTIAQKKADPVDGPFLRTDFKKPVFGIHINRTFGGDSYHSIIDGNIDAGITAGEGTRQNDKLLGNSQTVEYNCVNVHGVQ